MRDAGWAPHHCAGSSRSWLGPVESSARRGSFYRGRRLVALDGTTQCVPDDPAVPWYFPKHIGEVKEFGYPMLRLVAWAAPAPS
ncbi:hypothetical protein [Streptomyces chartreusis]|uniref:hypothetical protein n=1 Tax=Streptomyces chartreusis TaxID=1969 RepID=UPI00382068EB